ncbi:hypothetical protein BBJ29_000043 [Phytophthora kernoviae]|uniref:AMP-dependent synthetase/ligase domain-containing protein n=1 Tax=Phytophthora kernoviae TaxID=325452 RepID=A0A3F2S2H0_9STRA|nr:hypothetical protein BBJ29_000043 [Phytophthora kernoviae]RLN68982.1 hypothetical protein BBP00_00000662 [Phytophthora kernoviae]
MLRGGLRSMLLPLGLTLLQNAGVKRGETLILCICPVLSVSRVALLGLVKSQTGITRVVTVNDSTQSVDVHDNANPQAAGGVLHEISTGSWLQDPDIVKSGCVCMLTSGSVGQPKVTACTWGHMLLQGESTHQQLFPKGPARIICGTSISHAFSINTIFALFTSSYDTQSELCFASNAVGLYALLSERSELFTALYATPGTYTALAAMPPTALYADVPYCAGTRLSLPLFRKMREQYGLQLMQNYGSTEMGDIAAWHLHGKQFDAEEQVMASNDKQLYVGSAWPGVEVRVENNGEVAMKTPWQSLGYVVGHILHRFDDEVHHTSDLGCVTRDENGVACVWLQGRLRSTVEVEWQDQRLVYSTGEIEGVIVAHPSVSDVLVLIQNEANREKGVVQVRVVLENETTVKASELQQWCIKHDFPALGDALHIEFANALPCSPAGKLMYT